MRQLSKCGSLILETDGPHVAISRVSELHHRALPAYNLSQILRTHRADVGLPPPNSPVTASLVEWESPGTSVCTKVALAASDASLNVVLVLVVGDPQPVIISADPVGVERLQWLPSIPEAHDAGAYANCTLLAVFAKMALEVKVFSLLATHAVACVPRPLHGRVVVRPLLQNVWSVVAASSVPKLLVHLGRLLSLLHFYSDGITCAILADLELDWQPGPLSLFAWSSSGRWLAGLDCDSSSVGYSLYLYNIFGLYNTGVVSVTRHKAQPTAVFTHNCDPASALEICANHKLVWGSILDMEYILIFPEESVSALALGAYLANTLCEIKPVALTLSDFWIGSSDTQGEIRYSQLTRYKPTLAQWRHIETKGLVHVLASESEVLIIEGIMEETLIFKLRAAVIHSASFLRAKIVSPDEVYLIFATHAARYTSETVQLVASFVLEDALITESSGQVFLSTAELTGGTRLAIRASKQSSSSPRYVVSALARGKAQFQLNETEELTDTFQGHNKRRKFPLSPRKAQLSTP